MVMYSKVDYHKLVKGEQSFKSSQFDQKLVSKESESKSKENSGEN